MKSILRILVLVFFVVNSFVFADESVEPKIIEHLGKKVPLDLNFKDESGKTVRLKDAFTKSTILDFAYFHCTGICTPLMSEIANVMNKVDLQPGKDYNVVTISMDENETPKMAASKKNDMMNLIDRKISSDSWRFLTGDSLSIAKITNAAGFLFRRDKNNFIHTGVLIFVSSDGKICRYLYPSYSQANEFGILPFDFKMANMETAEGKEVPVIGRMLQFCFSYDPKGKTYVLDLLKISGAGVLLFTAAFVIFFIVKPKKKVI